MTTHERAALDRLANGIIPADARDAGAASVKAGPRLADRIFNGINAALYRDGLKTAETIAREKFGRALVELNDAQLHEALSLLQQTATSFFKQLRMDVCGLYLSDPGVWQRIGFPGPSVMSGGHPDFDQPQTARVSELKEPLF